MLIYPVLSDVTCFGWCEVMSGAGLIRPTNNIVNGGLSRMATATSIYAITHSSLIAVSIGLGERTYCNARRSEGKNRVCRHLSNQVFSSLVSVFWTIY